MGAIVPWSSGSMEKKLDPFDKYRKKWAHAAFDKPEVSKPASVTDTANTAGDSAVSTSSEKWNRRNRVRKSSILTSSGSNGTLLGG